MTQKLSFCSGSILPAKCKSYGLPKKKSGHDIAFPMPWLFNFGEQTRFLVDFLDLRAFLLNNTSVKFLNPTQFKGLFSSEFEMPREQTLPIITSISHHPSIRFEPKKRSMRRLNFLLCRGKDSERSAQQIGLGLRCVVGVTPTPPNTGVNYR